jgi:hypothetical protein
MLALGMGGSVAPMAVGDGYDAFMVPEYLLCSEP